MATRRSPYPTIKQVFLVIAGFAVAFFAWQQASPQWSTVVIARGLVNHGAAVPARIITETLVSDKGGQTAKRSEVVANYQTLVGEPSSRPLIGFDPEADLPAVKPGTFKNAPGRYAPPQELIYQPAKPEQVMARVDAERWASHYPVSMTALALLGAITALSVLATYTRRVLSS